MGKPTNLPRSRLLEQLRAVDSHGLALVVAPAGFGKTTLLGQWAMARGGHVRWCDSGNLPRPESLLKGKAGGSPIRGVVIDDVTNCHGAPEPKLERLIQVVAPAVPVLLAARRMPTLNVARHEFPSTIVMTEHDLTFRPWEITELFAHVYRDPLHTEEPLTMADRTGGWAAALRLWHLARQMRGKGDQQDESAAFQGLIGSYLEREVMSALGSGQLRRALRTSSVFDIVTAERMDLLLGVQDSHRTLSRFARRIDLVDVRDCGEGDRRYSYQVVLRNYLRSELLRQLGVCRLRQLYDRAADVAEQLGDVAEAFGARCRAHNPAALATLIAEHGQSVVPLSSEMIELVTPSMSVNQPTLGLARARLLLSDGRAHEANRNASAILGRLPEPEEVECRSVVARATAAAPPMVLPDESSDAVCLALLAQGSPGLAQASLRRSATPVADDSPNRLAVELALATAEALIDASGSIRDLDSVHASLCDHGLGWLRRLAYVAALCRDGDQARCTDARALAGERERLGDAWGSVLIESIVAIAMTRCGHPDVPLLERLCGRYRVLAAPIMEAWARSALALALAEGDFPDSPAAESAMGCALATAAPGPLALAYAAMGFANSERRFEFMALAQATALSGGMVARPWTWSRDAAAVSARAESTSRPRTHTQPRPGGAATLRLHSPVDCDTPLDGDLGLTCFGAFAVTRGGRPTVVVVRPVALTVLRILALHAGSPVHRDVLVGALWADLRESASHHNLHVAISSLRQGLEEVVPGHARQLVARQDQCYVLAPNGEVITDLQRFDLRLAEATQARRAGDRLGQISALRAALDLYVDDVLPSDGLAEWVLAVREGYRLAAAGAGARLAELELSRDHTGPAITAAQRSVQIDPCADVSWRTLIAAHLRAGEPAKAERAKQEYAEVLASMGIGTLPRDPTAQSAARMNRPSGTRPRRTIRTG